jgi:hypothetical protein
MPILSNLTVVLPTRDRVDRAGYMLDHVRHRPMIIVTDEDRPPDLDIPRGDLRGATLVRCPPNCGCAVATEIGVLAAETRFVVNLADDMEFQESGAASTAPEQHADRGNAADDCSVLSDPWLQELARVYADKVGLDRDGVIALRDGIQDGAIACFALFAKKFYVDHLYPTPYRRLFGDTELTQKAQALGVYGYAPEAFVRHVNVGTYDGRTWNEEAAIFERRMAEFGARLRANGS